MENLHISATIFGEVNSRRYHPQEIFLRFGAAQTCT